MKHTPGEWVLSFDGHGGIEITDHCGNQIGYVSHRVAQEANARLIAAAPDMLKALKTITSWAEKNAYWDKMEQGYYEAKKAIAKAEGTA